MLQPTYEEALCRRVLERYPQVARPLSVRPVTEEAGFSGARVWRVETERGDLALRQTLADEVIPARLTGLHRLLQHVRDSGVEAVCVPLVDDAGSTFHVEPPFVWQLEPWQPGVADFWTSPVPDRLVAALQMLAHWHRAAESFQPRAGEEPWFFVREGTSPGLRERRSRIEQCDAVAAAFLRRELQELRDWSAFRSLGLRILELYERAAPAVARELDLAREIRVPLHPCLRDIWHDHVLFEASTVTGLIDPHACRSDNVGTDLARLLGSLVGSDRTAWDCGLKAYQQLRPLSLPERGLVELFDRSSVLLTGLTWLDWVCRERRQFPQRKRVEERLGSVLVRLEELAQTC